MKRTPKLIISVGVILLAVVALGVYAYLQSREYLRGPVITILEPLNGSVSTTSRMTLIGTVHNAAFLTLNGKQIFTDERGRFRELLMLHEGYTIMSIAGRDRFGKTAEKRLELVYRPEHDTNAANSPNELRESKTENLLLLRKQTSLSIIPIVHGLRETKKGEGIKNH